jgi:hypothetical protein
MSYINCLTLGQLRKSISKYPESCDNQYLILLRKDPTNPRNLISEPILSGSLRIFDPGNIKFIESIEAFQLTSRFEQSINKSLNYIKFTDKGGPC